MSARGCLGKREGRKRLAENAFNMADEIFMQYANESEITELLPTIERPIHKAIRSEKSYAQKVIALKRVSFFQENGIAQHFRIKHKQTFSIQDKKDSQRLSMRMHEQETRECVEKIFEYRSTKVRTSTMSYVILFVLCLDFNI